MSMIESQYLPISHMKEVHCDVRYFACQRCHRNSAADDADADEDASDADYNSAASHHVLGDAETLTTASNASRK